MISPMTPSGTKVVAISSSKEIPQNGEPVTPLVVGDTYTIDLIYRARTVCGFAAMIYSSTDRHGYCLTLLRRLDLPSCLTDLLQSKPVDVVDNEPLALPHLTPASSNQDRPREDCCKLTADASASAVASAFSSTAQSRD